MCQKIGACLCLTVMDYDVFSNDDIAGHAFYPLCGVPGLYEPVPGGFVNVPQVSLNIFNPKPSGRVFESKFVVEQTFSSIIEENK